MLSRRTAIPHSTFRHHLLFCCVLGLFKEHLSKLQLPDARFRNAGWLDDFYPARLALDLPSSGEVAHIVAYEIKILY